MKLFEYSMLFLWTTIFILSGLESVYTKPMIEPKIFPEFETVVVLRVIDGDTIVIDSPSCGEQKIRLVGVDTPENTTKKEPFGKEAHSFVLQKIIDNGYIVTLEGDGMMYDRFGRRIAIVWLGNSAGGEMLNLSLISNGLGITCLEFPFSNENRKLFTDAERVAYLHAKGVWSDYPEKIEKIKKREAEIQEEF